MDTCIKKLLPRSFYQRPTYIVARELIGKVLIREAQGIMRAGIIVETEAYGGSDDPASHAYTKKSMRNNAMFGPVGHSYIYFIYGSYYCCNVVARDSHAQAGAVLIRALIPIIGIAAMHQARPQATHKSLTDGPGKLCQSLFITTDHNYSDMTQKGPLYITQGMESLSPEKVIATPRIGITKAKDILWRYTFEKEAIENYRMHIYNYST